MAKYIVKSDMNLGEQSNDIGLRTPVTVAKGQVVEGDVVWAGTGVPQQMIPYKLPSKIMGMGKPVDGMDTFLIPLYNLDVQSSIPIIPVVPASDKTFQYIVMGVLGIILTVGALKLLKVI
jgi:hypothetical protein